jgi:hypothetical protein
LPSSFTLSFRARLSNRNHDSGRETTTAWRGVDSERTVLLCRFYFFRFMDVIFMTEQMTSRAERQYPGIV